jgi:hypothetical protein
MVAHHALGKRKTRHRRTEPDTFPPYGGLIEKFTLLKADKLKHGQRLKIIANAVQASRLKDGANTRESYLANVLEGINNAHAARVADQSESLVRNFDIR